MFPVTLQAPSSQRAQDEIPANLPGNMFVSRIQVTKSKSILCEKSMDDLLQFSCSTIICCARMNRHTDVHALAAYDAPPF